MTNTFGLIEGLKIFLAIILGTIIGLEREHRGRSAGLRTHALVCLSSTILIVASQNVLVPNVSNYIVDPGRIAAGIVTGIGFLGAGAIIRKGSDLVQGITTAACIWFAAIIGIVVGYGAYLLAGISVFAVMGMLLLMRKMEKKED